MSLFLLIKSRFVQLPLTIFLSLISGGED